MHQLDGLATTEQPAAISGASIVGARAVAYDIDGRQGAVDVELVYHDGTKAALEITSHVGDGIRQRDGILVADDNQWDAPGQWTWDIRDAAIAGPKFHSCARSARATGLTRPEPLGCVPLPDDLRSVALSGISFWYLSQDLAREHVVCMMFEGAGGSIDKRLAGLTDAISTVLAKDNLQRHVEELGRSDHREKHLFVSLYEGAIPLAQVAGLISPDVELPECDPPSLPDGIRRRG